MIYSIQRNGFRWEITYSESSHRWRLRYRRNKSWLAVATYTAPGAAALAVASGDTGISDWDDAIRDPAEFDLTRWRALDEHSAVNLRTQSGRPTSNPPN